MTQEEKQLLLQDLCARLPYGVKYRTIDSDFAFTLKWIDKLNRLDGDVRLENAKIFLRPLSSMTEEEKKELVNHVLGGKGAEFFHVTKDGSIDGNQEAEQDLFKMELHWINFSPETASCYLEWLYEKQFDVNGLIPLDLAIEVTESNNPYKDLNYEIH